MSDAIQTIKKFRCPQCGDLLSVYFAYTKLIECPSCKSTIFLEDDAVRLAGKQSVLTTEPSIITLQEPFRYQETTYLPIGKIRYSYGRGFWEEWWLKDTQGEAHWLSVDEGDLVLEDMVKNSPMQVSFDALHLGKKIDGWIVTELGEATCEGFSGTLPKRIEIGSSYAYAHLSGKNATLRTLEFTDNGLEIYEGFWLSPFDIQKIFP